VGTKPLETQLITNPKRMADLSKLPSVDNLLSDEQIDRLISLYGRPLTLQVVRNTLQTIRQSASELPTLPTRSEIIQTIQSNLEAILAPTLQPVINASGVILHTNLGRAPLGVKALQAVVDVANGYSTLEFDLEQGKRGTRSIHAEKLLQTLLNVEAALVVNNNAGAVLLSLAALANRKKVIVSRSQLVEIGGGFRIPDVMKQSGAKLLEIGTTNRVHLADYESVLQEGVSLVLIAHHSNFKLVGFSTEPTVKEITDLAHRYHVPVLHDLGSGALLDTAKYGIAHEPTVQESLTAGVDLVCFSGDKLLGGPQAGIIVGNKELLKKISKHPLARALRADKLCLAALSATLTHYLKDEAETCIPVWQMLSLTSEQIKLRADTWSTHLGTGSVIPGKSTIGGGSLPEEEMDTYLLALDVKSAEKTLAALRTQSPPIIARIINNKVVLDPRTIFPFQEPALLQGLENALNLKKAS
jgi:L-seryl-tRNA(Ser) seleniumtransferase